MDKGAKGEVKIKSTTVTFDRIVLSAVRKSGASGISVQQLMERLKGSREFKIMARQEEAIKSALQKSIDRGVLKREGDRYKMVQKTSKRKQKVKCVICIKDWGSGCKRLMTLPCNHVFCRKCIQKWLKQVRNCPTCRAVV